MTRLQWHERRADTPQCKRPLNSVSSGWPHTTW